MQHKKTISLLGNTPNQSSKFRRKNWVEVNDHERGTYNFNSLIKFKTSMLRSSFCDYSDAYILVSRTITVAELVTSGGKNGIEKVFQNCAPFTDCTSEINNTRIHNGKDNDVVMPMYNLIKYTNNC